MVAMRSQSLGESRQRPQAQGLGQMAADQCHQQLPGRTAFDVVISPMRFDGLLEVRARDRTEQLA
ncbi:hypothetical protein D3C84_1142680 [compost metagenome]